MTTIKEPSHSIEYKYDGIFDLDALYKNVEKWFKDRKYHFEEDTHKFKPPELELKYKCSRKNTGYRRTDVVVAFHFWKYKDVIVKVGGKEKKMVSASYQLKMEIEQVYDYENEYSGPFMKKLQKFLHRFIWYYKIRVAWDDEAYDELEELYAMIKKTMKATASD